MSFASFVDKKVSFKNLLKNSLTSLCRFKAEELSTKRMPLNNAGPKEDSAVKFM